MLASEILSNSEKLIPFTYHSIGMNSMAQRTTTILRPPFLSLPSIQTQAMGKTAML